MTEVRRLVAAFARRVGKTPEDALLFKAATKSEARVADLGEVFTPLNIVEDMLEGLHAKGAFRLKSGYTVYEPTCGDGNFLAVLLVIWLEEQCYRVTPFKAMMTRLMGILQSLHGADICESNVTATKHRIFLVLDAWVKDWILCWHAKHGGCREKARHRFQAMWERSLPDVVNQLNDSILLKDVLLTEKGKRLEWSPL